MFSTKLPLSLIGEVYKFLGRIVGYCIRTGNSLMNELPIHFYKMIVGDRVCFEDLKDFNIELYNQL